MPNGVSYLSEIVAALFELGGMGSLREITERIKNRGLLASMHSNRNWRNNVRAVIQRHCSQTQSYRGAEDLFYSVYGLGEGYWGLRSMQNTDIADAVNPIIQREISEIKEISEYNKRKIVREVQLRNFYMSAEMKINLDYHRDVIFKG